MSHYCGGHTSQLQFQSSIDYFQYDRQKETEANKFDKWLTDQLGDKLIFFNEMYDDQIYNEVAGLNTKYKKLLYNDLVYHVFSLKPMLLRRKREKPAAPRADITKNDCNLIFNYK